MNPSQTKKPRFNSAFQRLMSVHWWMAGCYFRSGDADRLVALDEEVDKSSNTETTKEENTATRKDAVNIASRLDTTISTQNRGILGGLYLVEGAVINEGKTVKAVYRWDRKSNATRLQLRNLMAQ